MNKKYLSIFFSCASGGVSIFVLTLLTGILSSATSSAQFILSAELRPRLEFRDGFRTLPPLDSKPAFFISQRTRLNASYAQKKFSLKVSFQDVRTWGDEELGQDFPAIGLHEAYGQLQFSDQTSLRIGRQELIYDDERLVGASNWTQNARSFDAALFKFRNSGWEADIAGAFNQQKENLFGTDYTLNAFKVLGFFHAGRSVENKYKAYLVFLTDGFQGSDSTRNLFMRYTYGINGEYSFSKLKVKAFAYSQSGTSVSTKSINGYFLSAQAYYTFERIMCGMGIDYLSGANEIDTSKKITTFNTLYATNHPTFGHIDYFENIPADTKNGGLMDTYFKLSYRLNDKVTGYADYHYFTLTGKITDPANGTDAINSYLGSEIDVWFIYKFAESVEIRPGMSAMFGTESMNVIKGGDRELTGLWAYLQLTINPVLFRFEGK